MKSIVLESSRSDQPAAGMLHQRNPYAWMAAALFVLLAAMFASGSARSQQAPANSVIGNQASATYVDVTNTLVTLTATSNTVQTTVSQVFSLLLSAGGTSVKPANQQVCYPHTLTNTGNGTDTFALTSTAPTGFTHNNILFYPDVSPADGVPDAGPPITSTPALGAGQTYTFVVCGTTPPAATGSGTIPIKATSSSTSVVATATDTTTIGNCSIALTKTLSTTAPPTITPITGGSSPNTNGGSGLFVVIGYTNSGSVGCDNVVITDNLTAAGGGFLYRIGSGRWSNTGAAQALTDAADGNETYSGNVIDYSAPTTDLAVGTVVAKIGTVPNSTSGNIFFRVNVKTGLLVGTSATANTATVAYNDAGTTTPTLTGSSNTATYNVQQVADVGFNGSSSNSGNTAGEGVGTTIVASASPGQTITFTNYVWNRGNAADNFDIRFADGNGTVTGTSSSFGGANCTPGSAVPFACTFPAGTVFTMYRSDGVTTLIDNSGNSIPDTGSIPLPTAGNCPAGYVGNGAAGASTACGYAIVIKALLPAGAATGGGPYSITLQARSVYDTAVVETVPNVLTTIAANSVDLTNNKSIAGGAAATDGLGAGTATPITINTLTPSPSASTTTRFQLYVNNTSTVPLIFDLSSTFVAVPSSVGLAAQPVNWQVQFKFDGGAGNCSTVGSATLTTGATPVAAGGSQLICAEVTVPPTNQGGSGRPTDSPPGNYDIQFRAQQSGNASVADTKVDRITLGAARAVAITPNGNQQTSPGGAVTYQHTITNSGNVAEAISFASGFLSDSAASWTSAAYVDDGGFPNAPVPNGVLNVGTDSTISTSLTFTMAPNTTRTIFVRVNAPNVYSNTPDVTTLTATYTYSASALTTQVTDTTTMNSGLRLDKYQVVSACNTPITGTTFTSNVPTNNSWSSAAIPAGPNTAPGKCIAYLVVGVNTTANNVSNITISDIIPNNTKYAAACSPAGAAQTTGPLFASTVPADGATGTIVAVSAATSAGPADPTQVLLPNGRVTLQFCVKIN